MSNAACRVTIRDSNESYECSPDQSLLKAMVALGRTGIPSGCHGGGCGICKVRVVSGRARTGVMSRAHVSVEEERDGYALACRSYPETDVVIEVAGKMRKGILGKKYGFV